MSKKIKQQASVPDPYNKADFAEPKDAVTLFETKRVKPLDQVTAADVPRGLDPEDVATDWR